MKTQKYDQPGGSRDAPVFHEVKLPRKSALESSRAGLQHPFIPEYFSVPGIAENRGNFITFCFSGFTCAGGYDIKKQDYRKERKKETMKMRHGLIRLLFITMTGILSLYLTAAASESSGIRQGECAGVESFFGQFFYAENSLPEEVSFGNPHGDSGRLQLTDIQGGSMTPEKVTECEVTFLGGSEELKEALEIRHYGRDGGVCLGLNYEHMQNPGEAVFDISLRSATYVYRSVKTLRVISFQEKPAFRRLQQEEELTVHPGDVLYAQDIWLKFFQMEENLLQHAVVQWAGTENYATGAENSFGTALRLKEQGEYALALSLGTSNITCSIPVRIRCVAYDIQWKGTPVAGQAIRLQLIDDLTGTEVPCRWEVAGNGGEIDASGRLQIDENMPAGEELRITASPDSGEFPVERGIRVQESGIMLKDADLSLEAGLEGFHVRLPGDDQWIAKPGTDGQGNYLGTSTKLSDGAAAVRLDCYLSDAMQFTEDAEKARSYYDKSFSGLNEQENGLQTRERMIDGHPARLALYEARTPRNDGSGEYDQIYGGMISYTRNTKVLFLRLNLYNPTTDYVSFEDLEFLCSQIAYQPAEASFREEDTAFRISARNEEQIVSAGKSLSLEAVFDHPEFMNPANGNDGIIWEVIDEATGIAAKAAHMNKNNLITYGDLLTPARVRVTARSEKYPDQVQNYEVTILPECRGIRTDVKELELWLESGTSGRVQAVPAPEGFPAEWLKFEMEDGEIAGIKSAGNGTAEIEGLRAGRTQLKVSEPGGRSTSVNVRVKQPVKALDIEYRGSMQPGKTVRLKAVVYPEDASEKDVVWSTDADKETATLKKDGSLKISKRAVSGTEITVTCTSEGAPEKVVATRTFVIGEE